MYTIAAIIYCLCAAFLCVYLWWLSRAWQGLVKSCVRLWAAIILFIPSQVVEDGSQLAPAFMKVLFISVTDGWASAEPHATPLLAALIIATAVIFSVALVNWVKRPKPDAEQDN